MKVTPDQFQAAYEAIVKDTYAHGDRKLLVSQFASKSSNGRESLIIFTTIPHVSGAAACCTLHAVERSPKFVVRPVHLIRTSKNISIAMRCEAGNPVIL